MSRTGGGILINGAAGTGALGSANDGVAGVTIVVVSSDVSGNSTCGNGGNFMLVNGVVSSFETPCDGGASLGANGEVSGAELVGTIIGEVSMLIFSLNVHNVKARESIAVTSNKG